MKRVHKAAIERKKIKTRARITGTETKPRLSVYRSNKFIYVQAINDVEGKTIAFAKSEKSKSDTAGKTLGETLKKAGINEAVFDRGGYKYHGNIKKVADSVRESGIKF